MNHGVQPGTEPVVHTAADDLGGARSSSASLPP
ncbi:hypothetical protein KM540_gp155 [Western grey kangaroopox virus]|uniref:Uncharacterized protein n=2 Tax=Macropopoxvirus TaxID=2733295 RepID=A0A2C9DTB8_9POXV|nr:hypothetical protein KM540_gp155 [Western grey kangaroopox virus]YP_010085441.1 hypothetical protein KM541_gp155 [Eastern grey kangaroopox virus]ATI21086.1 hypothetical protein [Western grey kangaroopox virus]ATI21251.1 hypothetical protein [Eastern grey kangaroopox virus]AXK50190.1 hypothetical protein EKPV-NSW-ORF172 [Eastern grey kangaroopox virus]